MRREKNRLWDANKYDTCTGRNHEKSAEQFLMRRFERAEPIADLDRRGLFSSDKVVTCG